MEINQLCTVLQGCLSDSKDTRSQAEAVLKQYEVVQGQVVNLLRVAAEDSVDLGVRQVAAISFKNIAKRNWEGEEGKPSPLADTDKQVVRANILEALIRAPHAVQVQLGEVFKSIVYCDYPEQWPGLLQDITNNLVHSDHQRVYGALYALRILARKYEFRDEDDRVPLENIVNTTFPLLLQIFKTLLATPSPSTQVAEYIKLICKTFWSANFMGVCSLLLQEEQFRGWMTCLHEAMRQQLPLAEMPADEREKWPWWKARKWVLHIAFRLFNRYGEPQAASPGNDQQFSQLFVTHCSAQFLEDHLALMTQLAEGQYMSPRVMNLALQYLTHAIDLKATYKLLKPHIEGLLLRVVFPLMCFTEEDAELWEEDPQEYIRKGYDILEDMYSTKTAAVNFAHTLCSKKKPKAHLDGFMQLLVHVLNEYMAVHKRSGPAAVPAELARRMDGALLAVGTLNDVLKRKAPYKGQLGPMLVQYVLPCFDAAHGHLRAKACWVAGVFSDTEFASGKGSGAEYGALFQRVIQALHDPELPVRVDAVVALRSFVEELEDIEQLKPILPQLLGSVFNLMNEVDNEDLVYTLEAIVEKFGDEIGPYALDLARNLVAAFWKYSRANEEDEDDDDETAAIAAYGCLKALNTLLDSVSNLKPLFGALEEVCYPIMQRMISSEGQDVFEDVLELLVYFTYFSDTISPRLWTLWPQIHAALMEFAVDYWDNILLPLDNFIHRDTATFLAGSPTGYNYQDSVFKMVEHSLTGDFHENDIVCAPKLLSVVLQCCRGAVDHWVEPYMRLVLSKLSVQKRLLKDELLLVVANALYYNAALTIKVLAHMGVVRELFAGWFAMIFERKPKGTKPAHFRQQQDKKVCVLGLSSLLAVPDDALPPEVGGNLPQLLAGIIKLLVDLKAQQDEAEERAKGEEEEEEEEDDDDEAEIDLGEEDDEAPPADEDEAYMRKLRRTAKDILNGGDDEEDDDDDDDDWTDDDDGTVQSPLDAIDPFIMFANTLTGLQGALPARYAAALSGADAGVHVALQGMMMLAAAQREKLQEEELKQQQQQQPGGGA